jgi:hypothetical protein
VPNTHDVRFVGYDEAMRLKEPGYAGLVLRFVRGLLLVDVIVALIVAVINLLLNLHTLLAYGTLLVWASIALIVVAAILVTGGLSSRLQDVGAYNLTRAGDMSENLHQVAEAGRNSIGCSLLLLLAGITLFALGNLLQAIAPLFG